MNLDGANEADVREDIAAPLLAALGYRRGTENDIAREYHLSYGKLFLGRKKNNDPPLQGRADYVLIVTGAARWVLETKAPSEDITQNTIEQAISYARHPEVSGAYAVILNGRRLIVFHQSQKSTDSPIIDFNVTSLDDLAAKLQGVLSPAAIRRDCGPPKVDLGLPLADGFRSNARIERGVITHSDAEWECNFPLPDVARKQLDDMCLMMRGYRVEILGGTVFRDQTSQIRAKLDWNVPHEGLLQFVQDKNLMNAEYVSLSSTISSNPEQPTVFDVVGSVHIAQGEKLFNIMRWNSTMAGLECLATYRGQSTGYIEGGQFSGNFQAEYEHEFPAFPALRLGVSVLGEFKVMLDRR